MTKKQNTKVTCPECGTEFAIAEKEYKATGTVIGKDSGLGEIHPEVVNKPVSKAQERINKLREAGVDVSNLFAMQGAGGNEYVARINGDGMPVLLSDDDPLFSLIIENGTIPNRKLFRRWVMAQMFYMMVAKNHRGDTIGITQAIHNHGYEYQWRMLINEIYAQVKMYENHDYESFTERSRWFNNKVATSLASHYIQLLEKKIEKIQERKCKGIPYKRIAGKNYFCSDIYQKIILPLQIALRSIQSADTPLKLYCAILKFNSLRIPFKGSEPQNKDWVDAFKGAGAFYTMQNMIRFHNCVLFDVKTNEPLSKYESLKMLSQLAEVYKNEGWRLLGVFKKFLNDNNVDVAKKRAEWRNKA